MAFPTATQCMDAARSRGADLSADQLTDTILLPGVQSAVRDLFRVMANYGNPRIIKTEFYPLPAYTSVLSPATAGIADMGEPIMLAERGGLTTVTASAVTVNSANIVITTSSPHGLSTGSRVTLNKLGGLTGAGGMYVATASGASELTINGLVASGTFTSGGTVGYSTEKFTEITLKEDILLIPADSNTIIGTAVWQGDRWHLRASSEVRELAIVYYSSATVPSAAGDTIAVDDCIDFIAARALGVVCATSAPQIAAAQNEEAFGPDRARSGRGGLLGDLVRNAIRTMQISDPSSRQRPPFRSRYEYTSSWAEQLA